MSEKKRKPVSVEVLGKDSAWREIAKEIIREHHHHLVGVDIALCWKFGWKADEDGRQKISEGKRANDTDRALRQVGGDVVIYLSHEIFNSGAFDEREGRYWIDHALAMVGEKLDSEGEPARNQFDSPIFRNRKPDITAFSEVLKRHGVIDQGIRTAREIILANSDRDQTLIAWMENREASKPDAAPSGVEEEPQVEPTGVSQPAEELATA